MTNLGAPGKTASDITNELPTFNAKNMQNNAKIIYYSANQAIMKYLEIQAVVHAFRNIRGLPWPQDHKKKKDEDILDWLPALFGFLRKTCGKSKGAFDFATSKCAHKAFSNPPQRP